MNKSKIKKKMLNYKIKSHLLDHFTFDLDWNKTICKQDFLKLRNPGSFLGSTKYSKKMINHRWILSATSILPMINILHGRDPKTNYLLVVNLLLRLISNHGEREALSRLKSYRLAMQQFILDQNITPIRFLKKDLDKFPKIISFLKPSDKTNLEGIRYSLSVMRLIDLFKLDKDFDTSSITDPSTFDNELINNILKFMKSSEWLTTMKAKRSTRLFLSNHAGPNGPATVTAPYDLSALLEDKNIDLLKAIDEQLVRDNSPIRTENCSVQQRKINKDSKIIFISDKAGKTRQVAIADYFTNLSLTGIHDTFMSALENLKTDLTYSQDSIPRRIKGLGLNLYSSDLKSFTDRFPRLLGKAVVETVFDSSTAERWETLVSNREFYIKETQQYVRYSVGTPMGLLSSWPVNTVAHHIVKQYCAYKLGCKNYKYLILGDDTLDTDHRVYNLYLKVIDKLGVQISPAKCTISETGSVEFAKRLFYKSQEVTGIPINLLVNIEKSPEQFPELVRLCRQRGYTDKLLGPRLKCLLSFLQTNVGRTVADVLSLPEELTGQAPLLEVCPGSYAEVCSSISKENRNIYLELARKQIFWQEVNNISLLPAPLRRHQTSFEVGALDPLVMTIEERLLENYASHDSKVSIDGNLSGQQKNDAVEYSIYYSWIKGEYKELCNLPRLDTYTTKSKGHKITKCKYEILKRMLLLIHTQNTHLFVTRLNKLSNTELYSSCLFSFVMEGFTMAPTRRSMLMK